MLGGESSESSAHARKSLCTQLVQERTAGIRAHFTCTVRLSVSVMTWGCITVTGTRTVRGTILVTGTSTVRGTWTVISLSSITVLGTCYSTGV